jgi:hypothetical protein
MTPVQRFAHAQPTGLKQTNDYTKKRSFGDFPTLSNMETGSIPLRSNKNKTFICHTERKKT